MFYVLPTLVATILASWLNLVNTQSTVLAVVVSFAFVYIYTYNIAAAISLRLLMLKENVS